MTPDPLVTGIIPTYNRERLIEQAVETVLAQTYRYWELVIVDDGSTDQTASVLSRFRGPRIRVVSGPHAGLAAVARNRGIGHARGEYIAFLDSDDAWIPDKLETQLHAAARTVMKAVRRRPPGPDRAAVNRPAGDTIGPERGTVVP